MRRESSSRGRPAAMVLVLAAFLAAASAVRAQEAGPPDSDRPVLDLASCVRLALESSPTLLMSDARRHVASQDVTAAYFAWSPNISLSRTWQKSERTDFDVEQSMPGTFQTVDSAGDVTTWQTSVPSGTYADETINTAYKDWGAQARLNLFEGFGKWSTLGSARSTLRAAEASFGYTREQVVQDVVTAYYNLLRYEELLTVANEARDRVAKELEKTETYFRLGSAAKSDVLQQRVQLENTKLDVVRAQNAVQKAFADLAYVMNRPLVAGFAVDHRALETDFVVEPVDDLYAEALTNRLDLAADEHALDARKKDVTTATAGAWPSLDLFVSYTKYENDSPYKFGSQKSENSSFGYQISWNVFDRWLTWSGRSKAKANARIAEYELEQARLNAQVEIRQLHNQAVEARELAAVSRETIEQSSEELRLAQERFRVGAGTTLDIIVAQANLANAKGQLVEAQCDFLIAQAQLWRAVGRPSPWTAGR